MVELRAIASKQPGLMGAGDRFGTPAQVCTARLGWRWRRERNRTLAGTLDSMIYAIIGLVAMSVRSLFYIAGSGFYPISLLIVATLAFVFSRRGLFDIFILSALGLGANVLAVCGLIQLLVGASSDAIAALLLIGCVSAGMLAATVKLIVHLARVQTGEHIL